MGAHPPLARLLKYVAADPHNPLLLAALVDTALDRGDMTAAAHWAQVALQRCPNAPAVQIACARAVLAGNGLQDAGTLPAGGPMAPREAGLLAAVLRFQLGDTEGALALLDAAPRGRAADGLRARCLHKLGQVDVALALVAPHMETDDPYWLGMAALIEFDLGHEEPAARHAAAAHRLDAGNIDALIVLGWLKLARSNWRAAAERFSAALQLRPNLGRAHLGLAVVAFGEQRFADAVMNLQAALQAMPQHSGSAVALGWGQLILGERERARTSFRLALDLDRNFAEVHGGLAVLELLDGAHDPARIYAMRALRLNPLSPSARLVLAALSGTLVDRAAVEQFIQSSFKDALVLRRPASSLMGNCDAELRH